MKSEIPLDVIRTSILKVPQNEAEDDRFRKVCAAQGRQRAPTVRELIAGFCDAFEARAHSACNRPHVSASRGRSEGPWHGHFAQGARRGRGHMVRTPSRGSFGGAPLALRV